MTEPNLYFIAGPIGNLADLSHRAEALLASADFVVSEDTRSVGKLLAHLKIRKPLVSLHEHSSPEKIREIIGKIEAGATAVYLTDAGTPNLSDPGGRLAQVAMRAGLKICPIPGPSALTALISVAPFSCSDFRFMGFFPKKKGRQTLVRRLSKIDEPVFFFESPHRIVKTLTLLKEKLPDHYILIGRELTKIFEEIIFKRLNDLEIDRVNPKGEFVFALVKRQNI